MYLLIPYYDIAIVALSNPMVETRKNQSNWAQKRREEQSLFNSGWNGWMTTFALPDQIEHCPSVHCRKKRSLQSGTKNIIDQVRRNRPYALLFHDQNSEFPRVSIYANEV